MQLRLKNLTEAARGLLSVVCLAAFCAVSTGPALGQSDFGLQARADAVRKMIILGVQQGITSLPPTSGQSFLYQYDPELHVYVRNKLLGPTAFRSPQTIGKNNFSIRVAGSYFNLEDTFGPITYEFETESGVQGVTKIGTQASVKTGLLNVGTTYGLLDWLEFEINMPFVISDVNASEIIVTTPSNAAGRPPITATGARCPTGTPTDLNSCRRSLLLALNSGELIYDNVSFEKQGVEDLDNGVQSGIGRISAGTKIDLTSALGESAPFASRFRLAFAPELFFPSPSEDEFAGSDTWAILPRFIAAGQLADFLQLLVDVGYDYDFDLAELRRFVWNTGLSFGFEPVSFDLGVGGSQFNRGIEWTPKNVNATFSEGGASVAGKANTIPGAGNTLGTTFVDFLGGIKVRLSDRTVLSGVVNVPLNDEGFRAPVYGTIALESYF